MAYFVFYNSSEKRTFSTNNIIEVGSYKKKNLQIELVPQLANDSVEQAFFNIDKNLFLKQKNVYLIENLFIY